MEKGETHRIWARARVMGLERPSHVIALAVCAAVQKSLNKMHQCILQQPCDGGVEPFKYKCISVSKVFLCLGHTLAISRYVSILLR